MDWLVAFAFLFSVLFLAFAVAFAVKPRAAWRMLESWRYRNPEAVEPSDASYALLATSSGIAAVISIGLGVSMLNTSEQETAETPRSPETSREECEEIIDRLTEVFTGDEQQIPALERRADELGVRVTWHLHRGAAENGGPERYLARAYDENDNYLGYAPDERGLSCRVP